MLLGQVHPQDVTYWASWSTNSNGKAKREQGDRHTHSYHLCHWCGIYTDCHLQRLTDSGPSQASQSPQCKVRTLIITGALSEICCSLRCSKTGYVTGKLSRQWIEHVFNSATSDATGRYHLLIVDSHVSDFTHNFLKYAQNNCIVVLCLLPQEQTEFFKRLLNLGRVCVLEPRLDFLYQLFGEKQVMAMAGWDGSRR